MRTATWGALVALVAAEGAGGIQSELARLKVDTALVLPSSAIDDFPKWSGDGQYVAANVMGTWQRVDLSRITLVPGTWHGGDRIGVIEKRAAVVPLEPEFIKKWQPLAEPDSAVAENDRVRVEFRQEELSTSLVITRKGQRPVVKWTTGLEECGVPVLSPDARLVAFLCLTNGLFVMEVE